MVALPPLPARRGVSRGDGSAALRGVPQGEPVAVRCNGPAADAFVAACGVPDTVMAVVAACVTPGAAAAAAACAGPDAFAALAACALPAAVVAACDSLRGEARLGGLAHDMSPADLAHDMSPPAACCAAVLCVVSRGEAVACGAATVAPVDASPNDTPVTEAPVAACGGSRGETGFAFGGVPLGDAAATAWDVTAVACS